jgi:hypothetical protein
MQNAERSVIRMIQAQPTSDGAGVKLARSLGTPALDYLDPFLMLDEFRSDVGTDYLAGFPDHLHRGFETVTYMLAGAMQHRRRRVVRFRSSVGIRHSATSSMGPGYLAHQHRLWRDNNWRFSPMARLSPSKPPICQCGFCC